MTENERLTINGKEVTLYREVETNLYRFSKDAVDMLLEALEEREQYRAIGTVEQLRTMFDGYWKLKDLCEEYEKYGLPEDYWKLNEMCKEYSAIDTVEEFKALKEKNETLKALYDDARKEGNNLLEGARNKAIDEFAELLKNHLNQFDFWKYGISDGVNCEMRNYDYMIDEIAEELKGGVHIES